MNQNKAVRLGLQFPEGIFLVTAADSIYFMPTIESDKAYMGWGQKNELHGKIARSFDTRAQDFKKYDVTYEVEDGDLIAARLMSPFSRSAGVLLSDVEMLNIQMRISMGFLSLLKPSNPPRILRAAIAGDDTMAVLVEYDFGPDARLERTLYGGKKGALEPLTNNYVQGGNSFYFNLDDGTKVALPYGMGAPKGDEPPKYGDTLMAYLEIKDPEDLAAFGIDLGLDKIEPHLDPFCPELAKPPQP
jgi:hypothetical protein